LRELKEEEMANDEPPLSGEEIPPEARAAIKANGF